MGLYGRTCSRIVLLKGIGKSGEGVSGWLRERNRTILAICVRRNEDVVTMTARSSRRQRHRVEIPHVRNHAVVGLHTIWWGPHDVALCLQDMWNQKHGNTYGQTVWRFASCLSVSDKVSELLQNGHCVVVVECSRVMKGLMSRLVPVLVEMILSVER